MRLSLSLNRLRASDDCVKTRQMNREAAASARPAALGFHTASVSLRETFDERETDAESSVRPGLRAIGLAKTLEDEREKLRRDALSFIFDNHASLFLVRFAGEAHTSAFVGELHGVGEDVREDLHEPRPVAVDHHLLVLA